MATKKKAETLPAIQPAQQDVILQAALNPDLDIEKMERMMALYEKHISREEEREYIKAMIEVQANIKPIAKDAKNDQTHSTYAKLETINAAITPVYTAGGFTLSFSTDKSEIDHHVKIICHVSHRAGHTKIFNYDQPLDDAGVKGTKNKTDTHARGSSVSYGRRYLTYMIFNLAIGKEDNDGQKFITADQAIEIDRKIKELKELGEDSKKFLLFLKAKSIGKILDSDYKKAINALSSRKKELEKKAAKAKVKK